MYFFRPVIFRHFSITPNVIYESTSWDTVCMLVAHGIGVGFPGFIDNKTGITRSANRRQWIHKPLMQDLHDRLTLPVWADNNARMRAVGREMFSSSRAPGTFAYFFVSKGLACPLMIENLLYSGHRASAGEIGHNVILPGGPVCPTCGKRGCLEAVSSESAILLAAAQAAGEGKSAMLAQMLADHGELSTELLLEAQRQGDAAVCDILRSAVAYLGMEIANIFNFISPSLITVDGLIFPGTTLPRSVMVRLQVFPVRVMVTGNSALVLPPPWATIRRLVVVPGS